MNKEDENSPTEVKMEKEEEEPENAEEIEEKEISI